MAQKFLSFRTQKKSVFPPERNLLLTPFQKTYSFGSAKILVNPKTNFAQCTTLALQQFVLCKRWPFGVAAGPRSGWASCIAAHPVTRYSERGKSCQGFWSFLTDTLQVATRACKEASILGYCVVLWVALA